MQGIFLVFLHTAMRLDKEQSATRTSCRTTAYLTVCIALGERGAMLMRRLTEAWGRLQRRRRVLPLLGQPLVKVRKPPSALV